MGLFWCRGAIFAPDSLPDATSEFSKVTAGKSTEVRVRFAGGVGGGSTLPMVFFDPPSLRQFGLSATPQCFFHKSVTD